MPLCENCDTILTYRDGNLTCPGCFPPERSAEDISEDDTVREACRKRTPLDGADAQALEHALTITEHERDRALAWSRQLQIKLLGLTVHGEPSPLPEPPPEWEQLTARIERMERRVARAGEVLAGAGSLDDPPRYGPPAWLATSELVTRVGKSEVAFKHVCQALDVIRERIDRLESVEQVAGHKLDQLEQARVRIEDELNHITANPTENRDDPLHGNRDA